MVGNFEQKGGLAAKVRERGDKIHKILCHPKPTLRLVEEKRMAGRGWVDGWRSDFFFFGEIKLKNAPPFRPEKIPGSARTHVPANKKIYIIKK